MKTFLKTAQQKGELRLFDVQFARHLSEVNGQEVPALLLAAALASNRISHGDTCLSLASVADSSLYKNPELRAVRQKLLTVEKWREVLLEQNVVSAAPVEVETNNKIEVFDNAANSERNIDGQTERCALPEKLAPLLLDEKNRLYLSRYWVLEKSLIRSVNRLLNLAPPKIDKNKLKVALEALFATSESPDWQKASVATSVLSNFSVITGGPGTGKTYTVTALLAVLLDQHIEPRKIALAAPTGKAAARLTQSIQRDISDLLDKLGLPRVTFEAVTLHKLVGARPGRVRPRHHSGSPLLYDVVIIDEASMIDLPMMSRTFDALANDARIVLIGDKDQLHSVESGMVLGDICGGRTRAELSQTRCDELAQLGVTGIPASANPGGSIADHIVYLEKSHRVQDDGGISKLAVAINEGDVESALSLFDSSAQPNLTLLPQRSENIDRVLREHVVPAFEKFTSADSPQSAIEKMTATGVLCALRRGPGGAAGINALVEKLLLDAGAIEKGQHYYHGRPLMITENSSHQRLYNGDQGIVLCDENGVARVHFLLDGADRETRVISPARLPGHETFYAMTIHKSQGSEYSTVIVILPEADSPILSRELLYTAITRARGQVILLSNQEQLQACIERRSVRQSGLREKFWAEPAVAAVKSIATAEAPDQLQPAKVVKKDKSAAPFQTSLDF